jgi:hypothetical protein
MKLLNQPIGCILLLVFFAFPAFLNAQYIKQPVLDKGSIESQFTSLLNNSSQYEYNGIYYKGIKTNYLNLFKTNFNDTIKSFQNKIQSLQKQLSSKNTIIDSLNSELGNTNELYLTTQKEKNSLNFLGMTLSKGAYNSMLWTIIFGLLALLIIILLLYRKNNAVTVQTKQDLLELKNEYEIHRKRALEREEKLARQHLDELNKYKK